MQRRSSLYSKGFLQTTKGKIDTLPDRPPVAELYPPLEISSRDQLKCSGEDGEKVCREIANAMVAILGFDVLFV